MKKSKTITFAYYVDDKWVGWYADSFGSVRDSPKVYSNSKKQIKIIQTNFNNKLKMIFESSFDEAKTKVRGLEVFDLLRYDSEEILRDKKVELRIVKCPYYNGPNPNFSLKIHARFRKQHTKNYHKWCKKMKLEPGIRPGVRFGIGLIDNFKTYEKVYPLVKMNNWIYADYNKVKEWAKTEPTKFVKIIKYGD